MKTARVLPKAPQIRSDTRPPSFRRSSQLGVFSRLPIILPIQPFKLAQDLDYRATTNGLLGREFVAYDNAIRRIINPRHRDKTGLYSCAGADISNFLLSTDATVAYFVDLASPRVSELQRILTQEWDRPETSEDYAPYKFRRGYARALSLGMDYIEPKIITELKCLGVERYRPDGSQNINFAENPDGRVTISFDWAYGSQQAKTYSITYIKAD
ncbi:MAG: hypothetical protein KJ732_01150, partial [Candidatus Margulisbacteria bacterium]|nr:hypothetical protein [Candidatus Margulisiibacteriota bacterium]